MRCVYIAWFGQYTEIAFLVLLFVCAQPIFVRVCFFAVGGGGELELAEVVQAVQPTVGGVSKDVLGREKG